MRRIALAALALCLLSVSPLLAADGAKENDTQEKDDICAVLNKETEEKQRWHEHFYMRNKREQACRSIYWKAFTAEPASGLLKADEFATYQRALGEADCDEALALVVNAFLLAYPRAPSLAEGQDDFLAWQIWVAERYYPEVRLCLLLRDLNEAQAKIERLGIAAERYRPGHQLAPKPDAVRWRDLALSWLMDFEEYPPAVLALAKLSRAGKVIRLRPQYQYFLLRYLVHRGVPESQLADLLADAAARLKPSARSEFDEQARMGEYAGPEPVTE